MRAGSFALEIMGPGGGEERKKKMKHRYTGGFVLNSDYISYKNTYYMPFGTGICKDKLIIKDKPLESSKEP